MYTYTVILPDDHPGLQLQIKQLLYKIKCGSKNIQYIITEHNVIYLFKYGHPLCYIEFFQSLFLCRSLHRFSQNFATWHREDVPFILS